MSYVSSAKATQYYHVSSETLRLWAEEGKVNHIKTEGGHRRYRIGELATCNRRNIIYARVSSRKQEGDLQRQIDYLRRKYPNHEIVKDIGSGLNFKRLGFKKILDELFKGNIKEVVVASSDRWCRFGAREFFGDIFEKFGSTLSILDNPLYKNPETELSEDLLEIITVFSARYYGRRKYYRKADNPKNKNLS